MLPVLSALTLRGFLYLPEELPTSNLLPQYFFPYPAPEGPTLSQWLPTRVSYISWPYPQGIPCSPHQGSLFYYRTNTCALYSHSGGSRPTTMRKPHILYLKLSTYITKPTNAFNQEPHVSPHSRTRNLKIFSVFSY